MTHDGQVDYTRYSDDELREAFAAISPARFPLNLANLQREIAKREASTGVDLRRAPPAGIAPGGEPKRPMTTERLVGYLVLSIVLLAWCIYGLGHGGIPFRNTGRMQGREAMAFTAMIGVGVLTNAARLASWLRRPDEQAPLYQFASGLSLVAIGAFVLYMVAQWV